MPNSLDDTMRHQGPLVSDEPLVLRRGPQTALGWMVLSVADPALAAMATQPAANTWKNSSLFGSRPDTAIQVHDPLVRFTVNQPVNALDSLACDRKGAMSNCATAARFELLKVHPEKYAPSYGSFCADAVMQDELVKVDPERFTFRDNKPYRNCDGEVQTKWKMDVPGKSRTADGKLPQRLQE